MTIECRLSVIGTVKVNASSDASVLQFGDSREVDLTDRAIALQRKLANDRGDETRFASYPIFTLPLPRFPEQTAGTLASRSYGNPIQVGSIRLTALRASSYVHAGCAEQLTAESRIKHIRQFNDATGLPRPDDTL